MAKRRRPLHTCGASILAIGRNAFTKAQHFDEPLGSMTKRAVSFFDMFLPFVYTMLYRSLAMLSFIDDHILTIERAVEIVFPPSKRLFDKLDVLVRDAEVLPEKFDGICRRVGIIMHKIPLLNRVFGHFISCSRFLVSILNRWGSENVGTNEKEIRIDASCDVVADKDACSWQEKANTSRNVTESSNFQNFQEIETSIKILEFSDENSPMYKSAVSSPISDSSHDESDAFIRKSNSMKCTYKEMLERGG